MNANEPLAYRMSPKTLEDYVGQEEILGQDKILYRTIKADRLSSIILWGPPGCGKTITALRRNVVTPLLQTLQTLGFSCTEKSSRNYVEIALGNRSNRFYLFGGKDESSAALIQGITLGGVFLDEVALMPRTFVEQALARCSLHTAKMWFNCNPDHPYHWFYREWIQKAAQKRALYLHFTMADNPGLSERVRQRYERLYSGIFYDRFVLGKWTVSSGVVYPMFSKERHVVANTPECEQFYISCDYGTVNPSSFGHRNNIPANDTRLGLFCSSPKARKRRG